MGGPSSGVSASSQFDVLERSYLALSDAFGALVVARHRGDEVTAMERTYGEQRRAIAAALAERDGAWAPDEQPMVASIESGARLDGRVGGGRGLAEVGGPEVEPAEMAEPGGGPSARSARPLLRSASATR